MTSPVFPLWVFVAVALVIALVGYGAAQFHTGIAPAVVAGLSTLWVSFVVARGHKARN